MRIRKFWRKRCATRRKTYLIIVPEQFTMQTQKELVSLHPAGGILNIDILSFQRLAYRIFEETGAACIRCSKRREKACGEARCAGKEKGADNSWQHVKKNRCGFADEIADFRAEAVSDCAVRTRHGRRRRGEKKLLAAKLKDTGVIYRAFEEYLENRYVTAEDVLEVLAGKTGRIGAYQKQ